MTSQFQDRHLSLLSAMPTRAGGGRSPMVTPRRSTVATTVLDENDENNDNHNADIVQQSPELHSEASRLSQLRNAETDFDEEYRLEQLLSNEKQHQAEIGSPSPTMNNNSMKNNSNNNRIIAIIDDDDENNRNHNYQNRKLSYDVNDTIYLNSNDTFANSKSNSNTANTNNKGRKLSSSSISDLKNNSFNSRQSGSRRGSVAVADPLRQLKQLQSSENPEQHTEENAQRVETLHAILMIQRTFRNTSYFRKFISPVLNERRILKSLKNRSNNNNNVSIEEDEKQIQIQETILLKRYTENPQLKDIEDRVETKAHEQNWAAYMLGRTWRSILSRRKGKETAAAINFVGGGGAGSTSSPSSPSSTTNDLHRKKKAPTTINVASMLKRTERDAIPLQTNGRDALALAYVFKFAAEEDNRRKNSSVAQVEAFREQTKLSHLMKERRIQKEREKELQQVKGPMAAMQMNDRYNKDMMDGHASFFGSFAYRNQEKLDIWKDYNEKATFRWRFLFGLHCLHDSIVSHRPNSKIGVLLAAKTIVNPPWISFRECLSIANVKINGHAEAAQPPNRSMVCFREFQEQEENEEEERMMKEFEKKKAKNEKAMTSKRRLITLRKNYNPKNRELLLLTEHSGDAQPHQNQHEEEKMMILDTPDRQPHQHSEPIVVQEGIAATPIHQQHHHQSPAGSEFFPGSLPKMASPEGRNTTHSKQHQQHHENNTFASPAPSLPNPYSETAERLQSSEERKRNFGEHEHSWIQEQRRLEAEYEEDVENGVYQDYDDEDDDEDDDEERDFNADTRNFYEEGEEEEDYDDEFDSSGYCSFRDPTSPAESNRKHHHDQQPQQEKPKMPVNDDGGGIDFGNDEDDDGVDWKLGDNERTSTNAYHEENTADQQQHQQHRSAEKSSSAQNKKQSSNAGLPPRSHIPSLSQEQVKKRSTSHPMMMTMNNNDNAQQTHQISLTQNQIRKQDLRKNDLFFRQQQLERKMLKQIMTHKEFMAEENKHMNSSTTPSPTSSTGFTLTTTTNSNSYKNNTISSDENHNHRAPSTSLGGVLVSSSASSPVPFQKQQQQYSTTTSSLPPLRDSSSPIHNNYQSSSPKAPPRYASPKAAATLEEMLRKKAVNPVAVMEALPRGDFKIATKFQIMRQELSENLQRIGGLGGKAPSSSMLMMMKKKQNQSRSRTVSPSDKNNPPRAHTTDVVEHDVHAFYREEDDQDDEEEYEKRVASAADDPELGNEVSPKNKATTKITKKKVVVTKTKKKVYPGTPQPSSTVKHVLPSSSSCEEQNTTSSNSVSRLRAAVEGAK